MADYRRARPLRHHLADPWPDQSGRRGGDHGECAAAGRRPVVDRGAEAAAVRDLHDDHPEWRRRRQGRVDGPAIQHWSAGHAWRDRSRARQRIHPAQRVRRPGGVLHQREAAPGATLRSLCRGHHPDADPERPARSHHGRDGGRLEIRLGDQRRYPDSDRHPDLARGCPDQWREPRARRGTAGGGRRSDRRTAPRHRDQAGQV